MRHGGMLALLALIVLVESSVAEAASFDCQRAITAVEKRICENWQLSDLDGRMAEAYAQARARAGKDSDALRRDQSLWLAFRNALLLKGPGTSVYEERIALLDRAFRKNANPSPLLEAMAAHLRQNAGQTQSSLSWSEYGRGDVFDMADMVDLEKAKGAPFDLHAVDILTAEDATSTRFIRWFTHDHVAAVVSYHGTMNNELWGFFRWGNGGVRNLELPSLLDDTVTLGGDVVDYRGTVTALKRVDESKASSHITSQALVGEQWEGAHGMTFRFDATLLPPEVYCNEPGCAELVVSARNTMIRYDRERDSAALSEGLADGGKALFGQLVERAKAPQSRTDEVPNFDGKSDIPSSHYSVFNEPAVYFPVMWKGQMLIGRIGKATFTDYESEDLILAIWRPSENGLTPVLGMSGEKRRGRFLFSVNDAPAGPSPDSP